ncbi:hypothetical protein PIB30_003297 [Stylosanthes scabra]|uniref:Uncharacterized protein n=1 Tax=Stylosanthes scabra TaxID=79078 RepID=A0ABU6S2V8_9FABA|nr:hypothetical protein [Stylosanthes scabra]
MEAVRGGPFLLFDHAHARAPCSKNSHPLQDYFQEQKTRYDLGNGIEVVTEGGPLPLPPLAFNFAIKDRVASFVMAGQPVLLSCVNLGDQVLFYY